MAKSKNKPKDKRRAKLKQQRNEQKQILVQQGRTKQEAKQQVKKEVKLNQKAQHRKAVTRKRQEKKYRLLLEKGYNENAARKYSRGDHEMTFHQIEFDDDDKNVYKAEKAMGVLWVPYEDDISFMTGIEQIKEWEGIQKKENAAELYEMAKGHSGKIQKEKYGLGAVKLYCMDSVYEVRETMEKRVKKAHKENVKRRKEDIPPLKEYVVAVGATDEFTIAGFGTMMNSVLDKAGDAEKIAAYDFFASYAKDYLPEIYDFYFGK